MVDSLDKSQIVAGSMTFGEMLLQLINFSIYCPPLVNRFGMVCRPLGTNRQERCSGVIMRMLECREEMHNWKKIQNGLSGIHHVHVKNK